LLLAIVRKELLEKLFTLRFAVASLCLVIGMPLLTYVRVRAFVEQSHEVTRHISESYNDIRDLHNQIKSRHTDVIVGIPPRPTGVFVTGLDLQGADLRVPPSFDQDISVDLAASPSSSLFKELDFIRFIGIVLGLLTILFSYDSIAAEKEDGTLALCMTYSVARSHFLLGKWLGGYLALITPFLIGLLIAFAVISGTAGSAVTSTDWIILAGLVVTGLLYAAALYSAGLFVSSLAARPATVAAAMLVIYLTWTAVLPNVSPLIASLIARTPSPLQTARERSAALDERSDQLDEAYDQRIEEDGLTYGTLEFWAAIFETDESVLKALADTMAQLDARRVALARRQLSASEWIARLSPYASAALAGLNMCGAAPIDRFRLLEQLDVFRGDFQAHASRVRQRYFKEWRANYKHHAGQMMIAEAMPAPPFDFGVDFPRFEYATRPLEERLLAALPDVVLLAFWAAAFYMAAYLRFARAQAY